jgi:hypothetical protein
MGWITALKNASIRSLVEQGQLQLGLFDERNLRIPAQRDRAIRLNVTGESGGS